MKSIPSKRKSFRQQRLFLKKMIEYLSKQIKTYSVTRKQLLKINDDFEKLKQIRPQYYSPLIDKNKKKLKAIPETIELENRISILHNHVDFLYETSNLRTIKTDVPILYKKILDFKTFKQKLRNKERNPLKITYTSKNNEVTLQFKLNDQKNEKEHAYFHRYKCILKKSSKKFHKAADENADYSEKIRNLTNSIQIEEQMNTSFNENKVFDYASDCFMVNKVKTTPCSDEKKAKRTKYQRCCIDKQNNQIKIDLETLKKAYNNLWNIRPQRPNILDNDLPKANFKGFERLLSEKQKEVQKRQEESEEN